MSKPCVHLYTKPDGDGDTDKPIRCERCGEPARIVRRGRPGDVAALVEEGTRVIAEGARFLEDLDDLSVQVIRKRLMSWVEDVEHMRGQCIRLRQIVGACLLVMTPGMRETVVESLTTDDADPSEPGDAA